jgi:hypothetical protein
MTLLGLLALEGQGYGEFSRTPYTGNPVSEKTTCRNAAVLSYHNGTTTPCLSLSVPVPLEVLNSDRSAVLSPRVPQCPSLSLSGSGYESEGRKFDPVETLRVQQPCSNPGEQRRTFTESLKREYAYLQVFLNISKQPRHYESAFAWRRSGVRIPSAPLEKYAVLQVKRESKMSTPNTCRPVCSNPEGLKLGS